MPKSRLAVLLVLVLLSGCTQTGVWRGYGGDGSRCLCSPQPGPTRPRLLWVTEIEGADPGALVLDEGGIYLPHSGGSVTKLDLHGRVLWRFDSWVSGESSLPPHLLLLPRGKILVSTQAPREETFLLNNSGEIIPGSPWLPWPAAVSPAAAGSGYTVACHQRIEEDGSVSLRIFGEKEGEVLWRWDYRDEGSSYYGSNPVVLEDERAFVFVETDGETNLLLALDSQGGRLWELEFPAVQAQGVGQALAASQKGMVIFGTARREDISRVYSPGWLYGVSEQGEVLWQVKAGQRVEQIFTAPGLVVANLLRTKLLALNLEGEELWQYPLAGWESNGVMDSRGRIFLAGVREGSVWLRGVDAKGRDLWELDTKQEADSVSFLALAGGILYLATDGGKVLAISD